MRLLSPQIFFGELKYFASLGTIAGGLILPWNVNPFQPNYKRKIALINLTKLETEEDIKIPWKNDNFKISKTTETY